jgi:hypothetical protein
LIAEAVPERGTEAAFRISEAGVRKHGAGGRKLAERNRAGGRIHAERSRADARIHGQNGRISAQIVSTSVAMI